MSQTSRQLAAIMFTDIVGYTAIMDKDEDTAFEVLEKNREIHNKIIANFNGKLLKEMGDGILASFSTVSDAVYCAGHIQELCKNESHLCLRIGIHQGEIVNQGIDVFGSGVNIASRIQAIAPNGAIWVSDSVQRNIQNKKGVESKFVKEESLKNVKQPVRIYEVIFNDLKPMDIVEKEPPIAEKKVIANHKSIAVLPFVNMSSDPEQEYFCEGISEEIINTIVQLPDLKVAGRTSCFSFKNKNEDLRMMGEQLGVNNILEGSVRKMGNRVRVTAQLIEVSTGFHLWSNKYDRELDDVFKIQDEIALEIANQLKVTLLGKKSMPKTREQTQNVEAYQLYCKGRSLYYDRGMALFEALKCFQSALVIDPKYALASSGLADTYLMLCLHGYMSPMECWSKAIPAAQMALKLGPDLAETHNTQAIILLLHDNNLKASEEEFKKALDHNPLNIQSRIWYALFLLTLTLGRYEEGIEQCKIAIENDPLSSYAFGCYALVLVTSGNIEEAIKMAKTAVELERTSMLAGYSLGYCYTCAGELEKAHEVCLEALESTNRHVWNLHVMMVILMEMGKKEEAVKIFEELDQRYQKGYLAPSNMAIASAIIGRDEYSLELAHKAADVFDPFLTYNGINLRTSRDMRNVKGFDEVLDRLGLSDLK